MEQNKQIEIDTRLGRRVVDADRAITFPRGLAGFEGEHDFVLLQIRPEAPLLLLQSLKSPQLGLLVADPYLFLDDFKLSVGEAELALLQLKSIRGKDAAVLLTVAIPQGEPEKATLNLTGPIIINYTARIGLQVPQNITDGVSSVMLNSLAPRGDAPADHGDAKS